MGVAVMGEFFIDVSLIHEEGSPERREAAVYSAWILTSAYQMHERSVGLNDSSVNMISAASQSQVNSHLTYSHYCLSPFISF